MFILSELHGTSNKFGIPLPWGHPIPVGPGAAWSKLMRLIQYASPSGKHVEHFPQSDFEAIVKRLVDMNVFEYQEGRHYRHFCNFQRDPLHNLNMSGMYEWINEHKKKLSSGFKAR